MPTDDEKLAYAPHDLETPATPAGRPFHLWVKLLLVWSIGLVVWAAYLVAIGYLFLRMV